MQTISQVLQPMRRSGQEYNIVGTGTKAWAISALILVICTEAWMLNHIECPIAEPHRPLLSLKSVSLRMASPFWVVSVFTWPPHFGWCRQDD